MAPLFVIGGIATHQWYCRPISVWGIAEWPGLKLFSSRTSTRRPVIYRFFDSPAGTGIVTLKKIQELWTINCNECSTHYNFIVVRFSFIESKRMDHNQRQRDCPAHNISYHRCLHYENCEQSTAASIPSSCTSPTSADFLPVLHGNGTDKLITDCLHYASQLQRVFRVDLVFVVE